MEEPSSTANPPINSTSRSLPERWGAGWIRFPLLIAYLVVLVGVLSQTPEGYFFQLGEITGWAIIIGTPLLLFLLWSARQRTAIMWFAGLALAQIGFIAFFVMQFRAEHRFLQPIMAEKAQLQAAWADRLANFHLDRLPEMLNSENEFHAEELPGLREQARSAAIAYREQWAEMQAWTNDAEKRIAAVNTRGAREFRMGFDSVKARNQRVQDLNQDYVAGIEKLTTLLIEKQGRYHTTKTGLVFDRQPDGDAYAQLIISLNAIKEKTNAEIRSISQP